MCSESDMHFDRLFIDIVEVFFIIVQGETMNRKIIVLLLQYLEEDK